MKKSLLFLSLLISVTSFAQTGVTTESTITVNGVSRMYRTYVPTMYNPSTPVPVIFNIHGLGSNASQQETFGDFRAIADTAGFIIVHPNGTAQQVLFG